MRDSEKSSAIMVQTSQANQFFLSYLSPFTSTTSVFDLPTPIEPHIIYNEPDVVDIPEQPDSVNTHANKQPST
ncbi:unnamed protein product [Amaranthus hypochondriacus]